MTIEKSAKLPNSRNCFVCGMQNPFGLKLSFYEDGPNKVICDYTVPERYQGYPGVVHGGIVASMLDEIVGRVFMVGNHDRFMYTAKLTTRYRKNVPVGKPLRMVGTKLKDNPRIGEAKAELYGPDGELLAEAEALLVPVPAGVLEQDKLAALGWKVYPDETESAA